jgi:hypothetical protein
MRRITLIGMTFVLLVGSSAFGQDVRYNFDKNTDFSKFKTYKWVALKDATPVNDLTDKQIKGSIDGQLATKGLSKVDGDNADLFVAYQTAITTEKQFTSFSTDMGPGWASGPGWNRAGWYGAGGMQMQTTTGQTSTIYVGQLDFDMYDSANKDLVWRGTASKTIDQKAKPDKQQKDINNAVAKLLKNYPPPVKK